MARRAAGSAVRSVPRLTTGARALDELLGGGIESDTVTEFYGGAGTGKTNVCLSTSLRAAAGGHRVVYVDTEGVSPERLEQVARGVVGGKGDVDGAVSDLLSNLLFFSPMSMAEQRNLVEKAVRLARGQAKIGLIVLDSATTYYRLDYMADDTMRKNLLAQILQLLTLAREEHVAVLLTNQVYTDVETDELEPVGGYVLRHNAKAIVRLDWVSPSVREAVLVKHRSLPEGLRARFTITADGLGEVEDAANS